MPKEALKIGMSVVMNNHMYTFDVIDFWPYIKGSLQYIIVFDSFLAVLRSFE